MEPKPSAETTAQRIADQFARLPEVSAVALAGSRTATNPDPLSDIDLYIYAQAQVPLASREEIARRFSQRPQLDNHFWEEGDELIVEATGLAVDITYRSPQWIEGQLDRVLVGHEASVGYSTCFWFNVRSSQALFDREGWFARLLDKANQPYSDALQKAIIARNYPILRTLEHSAYIHQLESAVTRRDLVSIQHRSAALLASYFDILFAVNKQLHPGEKRLISYAQELAKTPAEFASDVETFLIAASMPETLLAAANRLLDRLDTLLADEGLAVI